MGSQEKTLVKSRQNMKVNREFLIITALAAVLVVSYLPLAHTAAFPHRGFQDQARSLKSQSTDHSRRHSDHEICQKVQKLLDYWKTHGVTEGNKSQQERNTANPDTTPSSTAIRNSSNGAGHHKPSIERRRVVPKDPEEKIVGYNILATSSTTKIVHEDTYLVTETSEDGQGNVYEDIFLVTEWSDESHEELNIPDPVTAPSITAHPAFRNRDGRHQTGIDRPPLNPEGSENNGGYNIVDTRSEPRNVYEDTVLANGYDGQERKMANPNPTPSSTARPNFRNRRGRPRRGIERRRVVPEGRDNIWGYVDTHHINSWIPTTNMTGAVYDYQPLAGTGYRNSGYENDRSWT